MHTIVIYSHGYTCRIYGSNDVLNHVRRSLPKRVAVQLKTNKNGVRHLLFDQSELPEVTQQLRARGDVVEMIYE